MTPPRALVFFALIALPGLSGPLAAATPDWTAEKCARYSRAWEALDSGAGAQVSQPFRAANARFIAGGCTDNATKICPASEAEHIIVDKLALMVAMEGMSTTFLPFSCAGR